MSTVIKVENLSKQYRLGLVNSSSVKDDMRRLWHKIGRKENPFLNIGEANDRALKSDSKYVWSLQDINFEVSQGEVLGIIGKNGAGKSTLLKILSKITAPTTGVVKSKGRIASLLEVGTGFHPELTGKENIYLNGAILGMRRAEITQKLDEIIDFAGVERYINTPVKRYSSGMYVRLAFAVAAHLESEIMIIDEVLSVGDAEFQKKCIGKMGDMSKNQGRTVLYVSHNIPSVQHLCTHGILLKNGCLEGKKEIASLAITNYLKETSLASSTKLSDVSSREGTGGVIFTDYEFLSMDDEKVSTFYSGQKCKIRLYYEKKESTNYNKVSVAISLLSELGSVVTVFCSDYVNSTINIVEKRGYIECVVENLPLMEGSFTTNIMLNTSAEVLDWIKSAFVIPVVNGDFFGTGKIIESTHRSFLIEHQWSFS